MTQGPEGERILREQGGILVEIDRGRTFRVGDACLLHFKIRNLTNIPGDLAMSVDAREQLKFDTRRKTMELQRGVTHVQFSFVAPRAGRVVLESLVLTVRFPETKKGHRLVVPDNRLALSVAGTGEAGRLDLSGIEFNFKETTGDIRIGPLLKYLGDRGVVARNARFNFEGSIGDITIGELLEQQDERDPPRESESWVPIALKDEKDGKIENHPPRLAGVRDLVLLESGVKPEMQRRFFLFGRPCLRFGLWRKGRPDPPPLVVSLLPCRSRAQDPANYEVNAMISHCHGSFETREGQLHFRDESTFGTWDEVTSRQLPKEEWKMLHQNFGIRLAEKSRGPALNGRIFYTADTGHRTELGGVQPKELDEEFGVGAEHAHPLDTLRLARLGNTEQHVYFQVFRKVLVGAGHNAPIRIEGHDLMTNHAEILLYRGEWLVTSLDKRARTRVNGLEVEMRRYVPLAPGKSVVFGTAEFDVERVSKRLMRDF